MTLELVRYCNHIIYTLETKNQDYGNTLDRHGSKGIIIRMYDKYARLENMILNSNWDSLNTKEPNHETIDDNIQDLIGYCLRLKQQLEIERRK